MNHYQRPSYLSSELLNQLQQTLEKIAREVNARMILLADLSGQELSFVGTLGTCEVSALSALLAGELGASQQLAKMLGINPESTCTLRKAQDFNYLMSVLAHDYVLLLVAPSEMRLGWVYHILKQGMKYLERLLTGVEREPQASMMPLTTSNFTDLTLKSIDSMWEQTAFGVHSTHTVQPV